MLKIYRQLKPFFTDERGSITKILDDGKTSIRSILLITGKKGSVRANHYHKHDSHYVYMLSGRMEYTECPFDEESKKETAMIEAGDMVFSGPMKAHAMKFIEDSVFLALATDSRNQAAYEEDTIRIKVI